jgi:hypothetical protein
MNSTLAPVALAALAVAQTIAIPKVVVPDVPDLMVKTRSTYGLARGHTLTHVVYAKGARQRREDIVAGSQDQSHVVITQCDQRRTLVLNVAAKAYVYLPIKDWSELAAGRGQGVLHDEPTTGRTVTITVDAVDTGERRSFGRYTARHVITTRKTEPDPGASMPASVSRTDGWYIDLPSDSCSDPAVAETAVAIFAGTGRARDRVEFKQLGTARRGYPIEQTVRHETDAHPLVTHTELIELSDAPLDDALFNVPADYLPALPRPDGSFDLSKQDTVPNRLELYWNTIAYWTRSLFSNRVEFGHGYDD